jgi:hypothetical protein
MYLWVSTKDPGAVQAQVQGAYSTILPHGDRSFVPRVFGWANQFFGGHYRDYGPIDAGYHDFEHTLQGTLCLARILRGRHLAQAQPPLTQRHVELGILAILMHDTGYLRHSDDREGTGAKYTITHVERSAEFAAQFLADQGFAPSQIQSAQSMIRCTGLNVQLDTIPFADEAERILGFALATADLLGQMAAEDYVDKLPILHSEFVEAVHYTGNRNHFIGSFAGASDLIAKTPSFWEDIVKPRLNGTFLGLYRFLNDPYPSGPNPYVDRIEANIARIRRELGASSIKPA